MIKLLVWLAGSCGFLYLAWRFATWHLLVQLLVLAALFLWVVGGGVTLAYRGRKLARAARDSAADRAAVTPQQARAHYVAIYGEETAQSTERVNPAAWEIVARASRAGK